MPRDPIEIDSMMFGRPGRMSPWLLPGEVAAVVDPGPANRADHVAGELGRHGVDELGAIVLTHIHFDHAGGAGRLAELHPEATVYVHPRVAVLLADPERLNRGVEAVWGEATGELFGYPVPIPEVRVAPIEGGDVIDLGDRGLEVIATPGHTRAHLSFFDREGAHLFPGDAVGLQVPGSDLVRPSTPPSDFCLSDARESLETLAGIGAERLLMPHFGEGRPNPRRVIEETDRGLERWRQAFEELGSDRDDPDREAAAGRLREVAEGPVGTIGQEAFEALEEVNPGWLNLEGMRGEAARSKS